MNKEQELRLQAFIDGELPESEMREVAAWLARDPEAAALQLELQHTCGALKGFDQGIQLPESREFFWSKIEREIQRGERTAPARAEVSTFQWLRRMLIPASGLAVVAIAAMLAWPRSAVTVRQGLETTTSDPDSFTYRDEQTGTTLVWLSYGSENGLADGDAPSTIQ